MSGHAIFKAEGKYSEPQTGEGFSTLEQYRLSTTFGGNFASSIFLVQEISYGDTIRWAMNHNITKNIRNR